MENQKTPLWIYIVLIMAVATLALWWYWDKNKTEDIPTEEALEAISVAPPVNVETNPVKKVPSLNPVGKTNPFKISNPFE